MYVFFDTISIEFRNGGNEKMKLIEVNFGTTEKAKCGVADWVCSVDFSLNERGTVRSIWGFLKEKIGIETRAIPHVVDIFELFELLAKQGFISYYEI